MVLFERGAACGCAETQDAWLLHGSQAAEPADAAMTGCRTGLQVARFRVLHRLLRCPPPGPPRSSHQPPEGCQQTWVRFFKVNPQLSIHASLYHLRDLEGGVAVCAVVVGRVWRHPGCRRTTPISRTTATNPLGSPCPSRSAITASSSSMPIEPCRASPDLICPTKNCCRKKSWLCGQGSYAHQR